MVHLFALVWILHLNVPTATDADQEPNEGEMTSQICWISFKKQIQTQIYGTVYDFMLALTQIFTQSIGCERHTQTVVL